MRDAFKNLRPEEELPHTVKKEVFKTLDTLRLLADIIDLFTLKFPQTEMRLIDLASQKEERNDPAGQMDDEAIRQGRYPDEE